MNHIKYYQCYSKGFTAIFSCAPGTLFNPTFSFCDWEANVQVVLSTIYTVICYENCLELKSVSIL